MFSRCFNCRLFIVFLSFYGGAEFAGQVSDGQRNFRGWKFQDWKMTDKVQGWKMRHDHVAQLPLPKRSETPVELPVEGPGPGRRELTQKQHHATHDNRNNSAVCIFECHNHMSSVDTHCQHSLSVSIILHDVTCTLSSSLTAIVHIINII